MCEQKCHRARPALSFALLVAAVLAGCGSTSPGSSQGQSPRQPTDLQTQGKEIFARPSWELAPANQGTNNATPVVVNGAQQRTTWAILLATFAGSDHAALAAKALGMAREAGLKDAFVEAHKEGTALLVGGFDDPFSDKARDELVRVRLVAAGGEPLFPTATMAAPASRAVNGSIPELDLRSAKRQFGDKVAQYTLQVAVYTRLDNEKASASELAEFRKAAEDAAQALRREGEQAFYYHGPFGSSVTVGLFSTPDERTGQAAALRKKYPENLINGQPTKIAPRRMMKVVQPQRSFIVEVPQD